MRLDPCRLVDPAGAGYSPSGPATLNWVMPTQTIALTRSSDGDSSPGTAL